ncbi:hypothetical protein [Nocardia jinanensis]|nr:hypothetical protein [Nocardia jinanensis]
MCNRATVVAATVAEAVDSLGGWIFDRTAAGCETLVLVPGSGDTRALEILGATAIDLGDALTHAEWATGLDVLAAAADMYLADARIREAFRARRDRAAQQTYLWGRGPAVEFGDGFALVNTYQVSLAGQAFKRAALDAAGVSPGPHSAAEMLWADHGHR